MKDGLKRYRVNGERVASYLRKRNISHKEIADKTDFDISTIRNFAAGGVFYFNTIHAIAESLRVKPSSFELVQQDDRDAEPREFVGLRALVESAKAPMYFTDTALVVQHCNRGLEDVVDAFRESIVGFHVRSLLALFGQRVPATERAAFLQRQRKLLDQAHQEGVPNLYDVTQIDSTGRRAELPSGRYLVEIRGELVRAGGFGDHVASLVYYQLRSQLSEMDPNGPSAGDPLTALQDWFTKWMVNRKTQSPSAKLTELKMPSLTRLSAEQRTELAMKILTQYEREILATRHRASDDFRFLLDRLIQIIGAGSNAESNAAVAAKLNSVPELFGATLCHADTPVTLRYVSGVFEARSKGKDRKSVASGKEIMSLSVLLR